jgi:hypothetical protein
MSLYVKQFLQLIQRQYAVLINLQKELICGNKMPTRCNKLFLLEILLLAQHASDTTMPIIRSSRVLYRWLLPVVFGALVSKLSVWCGAECYVSGGAEGYMSGLRAAAAVRTPDT